MSDRHEGAAEDADARPAAPYRPAARVPAWRRFAIVVRRRLVLLAAVLVAVVAATMLVTFLQEPVYRAFAEVVLDAAPPATGSAPYSGEERTIRSLAPRIATDPAGRGWSVDRLRGGLSVVRPADTRSLMIGFAAPSAEAAARIANAYAGRYAELTRRAAPGTHPYARVISEAEPPLAPVSPRPWRNLAAALAAGLVLDLAAAFLAERLFGGLVSSDEVEARLGLPHLAGVPLLASALPQARSAADAIVEKPRSGFAETFRSLLQAIGYAGGQGAKVIAITSARAGEGKTTVATCLARTVALRGQQAVVVDCAGAESGAPGLREVLGGTAVLEDALVRDEASGAWTLPAGSGAGSIDAAALAALTAALRDRFDHVLLDTPAVLSSGEAAPLAALADLVVVLVRWRSTSDRAARAALGQLRDAGAPLGGVVLSQVDLRKQVKYAHGDAAFYYRQYSKYYS